MPGPDILARVRGYYLSWWEGASDGPSMPERGIVEYQGAVAVVDDRANGRTVVAIGQGSDQSITTGALAVTGDSPVTFGAGLRLDGDLINGPAFEVIGTRTTTGAGSGTLLAIPFADNSIARMTLDVVGRAPSPADVFSFGGGPLTIAVQSGTPTVVAGSMSTAFYTFGFPPKVNAFTWSTGELSLSVTGPTIAITGASNLGGGTGKVRVTCAAGGLTSDINSHAVDIAGIVGTTEANGTNLAATYVDATHFDLLAIVFANAWSSGGTVTLHTPPAIAWCGVARGVVAPGP